MQNLPLLLKPRKIKNIFMILISLGFVVLGISLLEKKLWLGVLSILFFGVCFIIFIINLLPNSVYLKIDERGIEMKNLFRITFIPWKAVNAFSTKSIFLKMVTFNIDEKLLTDSMIKGKTGAFPDTYGMSAKNLAALLNNYKQKFDTI